VLDAAIAEALGWGPNGDRAFKDPAIKAGDAHVLLVEARQLLHDGGAGIAASKGLAPDQVPTEALGDPITPGEAERAFLERHHALSAEGLRRFAE
jgi:hypothetical protein